MFKDQKIQAPDILRSNLKKSTDIIKSDLT